MVFPGLVAFKLFPNLEKPDLAYPILVKELVPVGLVGLILAGLVSAVMSTVSSVLNSTATLFTIDLYNRHLRSSQASERELVSVGRWSGFAIMLVATALAFHFAWRQSQLSEQIVRPSTGDGARLQDTPYGWNNGWQTRRSPSQEPGSGSPTG